LQVAVVQVVPLPLYTPPAVAHCASVSIWHITAPVACTQQAPVGGGGGQTVAEHAVFAWKTPFRAAHCAWVSIWHVAPFGDAMQHAPVGGGGAHARSVHTVPFPLYTPPAAAHAASVRTLQVTTPDDASVVQHAPVGVGGGHTVAEHIVFAWNTPLSAVHWASVSIWQSAPAGVETQHAPVDGGGGQFAVAHVDPAPWKTPPTAAHCAWVTS
jgi:hypothetical protein